MELHGSPISPFYERVSVGLAIKGQSEAISYGNVPGGPKSDQHYAMSPMGRIPVFTMDDGTELAESQTIAEYLDDILDGPKLIPTDPKAKAMVSIFCRIVDLDFVPHFATVWPNRNATDAEKELAKTVKLPFAYDAMEFYAEKGGLLQGDMTLADAALIPFLFHFKVFFKRAGYPGFGDRPILSAWAERMTTDPIAQASFERSSTALKAVMGG